MLNLKFKDKGELEAKVRKVLDEFFVEDPENDHHFMISVDDEDKNFLSEAIASALEKEQDEDQVSR